MFLYELHFNDSGFTKAMHVVAGEVNADLPGFLTFEDDLGNLILSILYERAYMVLNLGSVPLGTPAGPQNAINQANAQAAQAQQNTPANPPLGGIVVGSKPSSAPIPASPFDRAMRGVSKP